MDRESEMTLADHAEMYQEWVKFAFDGIGEEV